MNYTKESRDYIVTKYLENPTRETVDSLAAELQRPAKSIIGKLSREGVYRRNFYITKSGETPVTKLELVNDIACNLDVPASKLLGLEKSPKSTLKLLSEITKRA